MAQTSTTLSGAKSHISDVTGADISFNATSGVYKITSTTTSLNNFQVRDLITVSGTTNNNKTFTVKTVTDANELIVEEITTTENSDGSTTTTLDHTGFVTDKAKGDGYYSQPDGVHTVAYQVVNRGDSTDDFIGSIRMQGSLATTPTEDDYFDISGTTYTSDQSTTIASFNFTGNYVWVRAKIETTNASGNGAMVSAIFLNS
ncbi:MAG: hypothetical protein CBB97_21760 [Candidatus Endolissoclinum sp. TMED37]|nr:MAG: hypothetical protein CBB97_21760 [Candidatus Endolissoclinum sp. TMED37]|tara:strand:- start:13855 stop:14460 length:606 start_codon:yes stop_codon:yes gene_type:complete